MSDYEAITALHVSEGDVVFVGNRDRKVEKVITGKRHVFVQLEGYATVQQWTHTRKVNRRKEAAS